MDVRFSFIASETIGNLTKLEDALREFLDTNPYVEADQIGSIVLKVIDE